MAQRNDENADIRYLNPVTVEVKKKKYCRFKKAGIKYVDYKDAERFSLAVLPVLHSSSRRRLPRL